LVEPASLIRVEDMSRLGGLCQRVARVGLCLKIFGVVFVSFIIEPLPGASLTPERATVAGGLAMVVVASTTLVRRGRLLPVGAYSTRQGLCSLFARPDNVIEIRRELARVAPRVATQLQAIPDAWLHNALAVAVEPSGAITLYVATAKSQWTYMATLDDAARRLALENVAATGPNKESGDPISWWSFKALAAIVLGLWGPILISSNRPHIPGSDHGDLILGLVMVGVALTSGVWATVISLKNPRPRNMMLALAGLAAGSAGAALAVHALVA
jgi:hypothetical protein